MQRNQIETHFEVFTSAVVIGVALTAGFVVSSYGASNPWIWFTDCAAALITAGMISVVMRKIDKDSPSFFSTFRDAYLMIVLMSLVLIPVAYAWNVLFSFLVLIVIMFVLTISSLYRLLFKMVPAAGLLGSLMVDNMQVGISVLLLSLMVQVSLSRLLCAKSRYLEKTA